MKKIGMIQRKYSIPLLAGALLLISSFLYWQNNGLTVTRYTHAAKGLPRGMDGLSILHISDLHNKSFGSGQKKLLQITREAKPDIICITGDLIDRRRKGMEHAIAYVKEAVALAPVYYITGNHEEKSKEYAQLKKELVSLGVIVLDNESIIYSKGGETITIWGLSDPARYEIERFKRKEYYGEFRIRQDLMEMTTKKGEGYHILLAHRPHLLSTYREFGMHLILSGHAHGGQIRIPGVGAIFSSEEGLFPKYTQGMHQEGDSAIVISRGLGNSLFPFRIFNRPEAVLITLKAE